jgi:hypothetical protein
MIIQKRTVDAFGYISLIVLVLLFVATLMNLVPKYLQLPLFLLAVVLYLVRVTLRLISLRQQRAIPEEKKTSRDDT